MFKHRVNRASSACVACPGSSPLIGETCCFLSDCMNRHSFITTVSNPHLPVAIPASYTCYDETSVAF